MKNINRALQFVLPFRKAGLKSRRKISKEYSSIKLLQFYKQKKLLSTLKATIWRRHHLGFGVV
jgi:hypothetical protein